MVSSARTPSQSRLTGPASSRPLGAPTQSWAVDESGSIVAFLALVLAGFALAAGLITVTAGHAVRVARAQWAADAAALAAASDLDAGGIRSGRRLAEANGAELVGFTTVPSSTAFPQPVDKSGDGWAGPLSAIVVVEVELDGVRARAAAARFHP